LGIQKITLGPKSRFAADVPAEVQEAVDEVLAAAPREAFIEATAAAAGMAIGCGCGLQLLPTREATWEHQGVVHRYGLPCYRKGESKQLGALPVVPERAGRAGDQPLPEAGRQNVVDDLVAHLRARIELGVKRYGRPLETFNGRDAHRDELEEFVDGWIYRWQARMERAQLEAEVVELRAKVAAACCGKGGCAR
jgi:hypothetical protein